MEFDTQLDALAEVAVKVGVGLLPGQKLLIGAPLEAAPLARRIVEHAYKAGSRLVTVLWEDSAVTLARFRHAPRDSFAEVPAWLFDATVLALQEHHAYIHVSGEDPNLLAGQDARFVATASEARAVARRRWTQLISDMAVNWCVVPAAVPAWARMVFPGTTDADAVERLWQTIFRLCRVDQLDPVAAWQRHASDRSRRAQWLNEQRFAALHVRGPGTDLRIGLVEGHLWVGASSTASNGAVCIPNMPTEEVFTMPHAHAVEGHVRASKPLSVRGSLIEDIHVRFAAGRIVEASATRGQDVFEQLLDTDEGARRLGEVALVPNGSLVSRSGLLFYNSLFDENAASHIALGQCYSETLGNYGHLTPAQRLQAGANQSLIHVDWMIGSGHADVDGVTEDGARVPVMRAGEWVSRGR
jgi:aminopeptidase